MTVLFAFATLRRGRTCWLWIIPRCPYCRKSHEHGGGDLRENPRRYLSSRIAHCASFSTPLYWLTDDADLHGQPVPESLYAGAA